MKLINPNVSVGFLLNGDWKSTDSSHPKYQEIEALVAQDKFKEAADLIDVKDTVLAAIAGTPITLEDNTVMYKGEQVAGTLGRRIVDLNRKGLPVDYLVKFLENLMQNPSKRAVDELYDFLEVSKLPITDDGHFLAYKSVRQDFTDHHTGKMDNSVGALVEMPRNKVDEDKDRTCSTGLHFAAHEYAEGFGRYGRMVVLKINPRDVVAIPSDYNNQKGRACRYEILEEVKRHDTKLVGAGAVVTKTLHQFDKGDYIKSKRTGNVYLVLECLELGAYYVELVEVNLAGRKGSKFSIVGEYEKVKKPWTPSVNNFGDRTIWEGGEFIGEASEFPVNKKARYSLYRYSNDKDYDGEFFFDSYQKKHDNLVFKRVQSLGDDGRTPEFKYVTISDLFDWDITVTYETQE